MGFEYLKATISQRLLMEDILGHLGYDLTEPRQDWIKNRMTRGEAKVIIQSFLTNNWDNTRFHLKGTNSQIF